MLCYLFAHVDKMGIRIPIGIIIMKPKPHIEMGMNILEREHILCLEQMLKTHIRMVN